MSDSQRDIQGRSPEETERLYTPLFDHYPDPAVVHDGTRVIMANRAASVLFGVDLSEAAGRTVFEFIHPDDRPRTESRVRMMFSTMQSAEPTETRMIAADGAEIVMSFSSAPVVVGDRAVILTTMRDLTERKRSEHDLEESEGRFSSMVAAAPLGVHLYELHDDGSLVLVGANEAADNLLRIGHQEYVGKTIEDAFPGLVGTEIPDRYRDVARTGVSWSSSQVDYNESGIRGAFEVHAFLTAPNTMAVMFADITDRIVTELQLQELLAERTVALAEAQQDFDNVIAIVSRLVEYRDPYTAGHQKRVAQLAFAIAQRMQLEPKLAERIRIASSVHDIGKVAIPAEILSKPVGLTAAEYELVKCHSEAAYEILNSVIFECPLSDMVYQHHERLDGSGYPQGLKGDQVELGARVIAVSDVVEAMSSHRPYRPAIGWESALAEISDGRGRLYDAQVVDACVAVFDSGFEFE
jgi:PAS domain S-box-containing protein